MAKRHYAQRRKRCPDCGGLFLKLGVHRTHNRECKLKRGESVALATIPKVEQPKSSITATMLLRSTGMSHKAVMELLERVQRVADTGLDISTVETNTLRKLVAIVG